MTDIDTVTGPVAATELGVTLTHEHMFAKNPELEFQYPDPEWDEEAMVANAIDKFTQLKAKGIDTIVDMTVPGLGRFIPRVQRIAAAIPLNVVVATGWYTFNELPTYFQTHGPDGLVGGPEKLDEFFIKDITEGIGDTGVKAGMIKVATDELGITKDVGRVMAAAARAHLATGVTISTHTHATHFRGRDQQDFFRKAGVPLEHVLIGHCGDSTDIDYLRELMDNGSMIGLDRFGMEFMLDDQSRIDTTVKLIELGYAEKLTMSHDYGFFSINTPPSWRAINALRWNHFDISDNILPALRERGVTDETLHQIMVVNAATMLVGARA